MVGQTVRALFFFWCFSSSAAHSGVVSVWLPNSYRIGCVFHFFLCSLQKRVCDTRWYCFLFFYSGDEVISGEESVCVICVAVDIREHWTRTAARCRRKSTSEFHFNNNEIIASKSTLATPENGRENCFFRRLNRRRQSISGAGTLTKKILFLLCVDIQIHTVQP